MMKACMERQSDIKEKVRNTLCAARKECVFEVVIICSLVIFYENFTLWGKILFLLKKSMEVEYRMECVFSFQFCGFFFFWEKYVLCHLSVITDIKIPDRWMLVTFRRGLVLKNAFLSAFQMEESYFGIWITNVDSVLFCYPILSVGFLVFSHKWLSHWPNLFLSSLALKRIKYRSIYLDLAKHKWVYLVSGI